MSDESIFQARRRFLRVAASAFLGGSILAPTDSLAQDNDLLATLIDIDACDGCGLCVEACRKRSDLLVPIPEDIAKYRRRYKFVRDWSKGARHDDRSRLTPYNWLTIQKISLGSEKSAIYIPRRCMHCLTPTCAILCSTGALTRGRMGAVYVQEQFCVGDGSCTMNCPWYIPSLQPGTSSLISVTKDASRMFKCDYCVDLQLKGEKPLCIQACPRGAMQIGPYPLMVKKAHELADLKGTKDIFGLTENGGTLTFYVSSIPLRELEIGLLRAKAIRPGLPTLRVHEIPVEKQRILSFVAATPVAALVLAGLRLWRDRHTR